jgi:hypothetical protein
MALGKYYGLKKTYLVDNNEDPIGVPGNPLTVDATVTATIGDVVMEDEPIATSVVTDVPASPTPVTLLLANVARRSFSIFNDSDRILTIKLGPAASLSSRTTKLPPQWVYSPEVRYVDIVTGFWAAGATGSAAVTELTP